MSKLSVALTVVNTGCVSEQRRMRLQQSCMCLDVFTRTARAPVRIRHKKAEIKCLSFGHKARGLLSMTRPAMYPPTIFIQSLHRYRLKWIYYLSPGKKVNVYSMTKTLPRGSNFRLGFNILSASATSPSAEACVSP